MAPPLHAPQADGCVRQAYNDWYWQALQAQAYLDAHSFPDWGGPFADVGASEVATGMQNLSDCGYFRSGPQGLDAHRLLQVPFGCCEEVQDEDPTSASDMVRF